MHHRHCITKKASNFTELSAKYKLYLISSRRNFRTFPTWIHYRQLNLSPLRYTRALSLGMPSCHPVATKSSLCRCEPLLEYLLQMLVCPHLQATLIIVIEWKQVPRKGKRRKTVRQTIWSNPSSMLRWPLSAYSKSALTHSNHSQNPPLSQPLWIKLRYRSIWGKNREGKNAIPDYE